MRAWMMVGVAALGFGCIGCGSDPVGRILDQSVRLADVACECPEVAGETTAEDCRDRIELLPVSESEEACIRRVYADHEDELKPILECQNDAFDRYLDCVRDAVRTCPPLEADVSRCEDRRAAATDGCADFSESVLDDLDACA